LESEEIKASKKDIRTLRKVLKQGTLEQKEQIVSELKKDDFKNAIETAKEIEAQSKPKNVSPETEAPLDDRVGDIIANPEVSPTRSNSDLDVFLMLADRIYCPKCGKNAMTELRWSCCSLSLNEAANLAEGEKNKHNCLADSHDTRVEEGRREIVEHAGTLIMECTHMEPKSYSEMALWVPIDNSFPAISKIHRAFCSLLHRDEAPRVDCF
jgi:hypothetical protein